MKSAWHRALHDQRVAREFSAEDVKSGITEIQRRKIEYAEFLRRIMVRSVLRRP